MRLLWGPHEPKRELVCFFLPFLGGPAIYICFSTHYGRSMDYQGHCTMALVIEGLLRSSFFTSNLGVYTRKASQKKSGCPNEFHIVEPTVCRESEVPRGRDLDELHTVKHMVFRGTEVPRARDLGVPR